MLKLFLRFSRKQKLVMSFFLLAAVMATVLAFFIESTVLIISLFWLLAAAVFVMIMFMRRLNAKVMRLHRDSGASIKKKSSTHRSRLNSQDSLESLQNRFRRHPTADTALPLAKKLLQQTGDISTAKRILSEIPSSMPLSNDERYFVARVESLAKYLYEDFALPKRHSSYNYVPKKNHVLYSVGMSPLSVSNGYTSRTHGIATGLMDQGAKVTVAPLPGKPWDKGAQPGFRIPSEHRRYVRNINGVSYAHNPGVRAWERDFDTFVQVSADAYVREAMIQKPEFLLAASNYLTALPALVAARRLGIPFTYEMRGFWEVSAASTNPSWKESDQYKFDRKFELLMAEESDHVVVITDEMREDLIARGVAEHKIFVAPNCVDIDTFAPLGKDFTLLKRIGFSKPELPVVGFAGSVTSYEGLDYVAQALSELNKQDEQFNFLIIGTGNYLPELKAMITRLGLDQCTRYVDTVPNKQMPVYLSCIDIFPLARKSLPVTELVSPLKPLEAMSVGGTVLLSDVSPHQVFFEGEEERALGFEKDNIASLKEQLRRLIALSSDERKAIGTHARQWVKDHRQWSQVGAIFKTIFDSAQLSNNVLNIPGEELPLKSFTVAFIGDTFTSETFLPELTALRVTPDDWRKTFADTKVDALFIESAWMGNEGAWHGKVGYYDDETHAPLVELIQHSRSIGIPVLFWNKEDPVHFNRFKRTAAMCDYVFTTDARTIVAYNELPDNVIKTVASAPFAAQPLLHNPLPSTRDKEEAIAYGGTYYGDKYATRKQGLDFLFYESAPYGLAIYERVHNDPNSPYKLPERFKRYARPSLSYPEMCQAYKAHPIHLNGNSVVDSPTMFSRRVVEITGSGSNVLSSEGRGVDEIMAGTVPTVTTPDEANRVLREWKNSEEARHRDLWRAHRHVYETHTTAHRLTYMFRVAGFHVQSPRRPKFAVQCSSTDVESFEQQSIQPDMYLLTDSSPLELNHVPVVCVPEPERVDELRKHNVDFVICARENVGLLGQHDVEDLVRAARFGDWKAVGKRRVLWQPGEPYVPLASLTKDINDQVILYDLKTYQAHMTGEEEVTLTNDEVFAWQIVKDILPDDSSTATTNTAAPSAKTLTVLLAGHDFKFMTEISAAIRQAGHRLLVDRWDSHTTHNEEFSQQMLSEADIIFCEWSLGNLRWYSKNKLPSQKLITRFHAQELRTRFLSETDIENVDNFIFVSPVGMRRAQVLFGIPETKCVVVNNTFNVDRFARYRTEINPKSLGLVGSVPHSKRLDLALDILEGINLEDPEFELIVKGKEYTEYPWLLERDHERVYFESQYSRIANSSALRTSVTFAGHTPDLANWYLSEPGFILSTSDHEGTHQAIAEGGAAGCIPIIFPWAGAEHVYGDRWLVNGSAEAIERIRKLSSDSVLFAKESAAIQDYVRQHFSPKTVTQQILDIIES